MLSVEKFVLGDSGFGSRFFVFLSYCSGQHSGTNHARTVAAPTYSMSGLMCLNLQMSPQQPFSPHVSLALVQGQARQSDPFCFVCCLPLSISCALRELRSAKGNSYIVVGTRSHLDLAIPEQDPPRARPCTPTPTYLSICRRLYLLICLSR